MSSKLGLCLALSLGFPPLLSAAIIGTNEPAQPLTVERIAALPKAQRSEWKNYWERSERQLQADQNLFRAEMKKHGIKESTNAPAGRSFSNIPLDKPADWYRGDEARRIADIIVSFQTPAGGWSKRMDMTSHARAPGELFTSDNNSRFLSNSDNDTPHNANWSYVGTFDNGATTTQLRYLAKVAAALPGEQGAKYRAAFLHGLDYIFASQFPNGAWPQVWPLQSGYHDAITYNDNAMVNVLELLNDAGNDRDEFAFVPKKTRTHAIESMKRGIGCILATQIVVDGRRTIWCQQHDTLTLKPAAARNYEMPCKASMESAVIMQFLMNLTNPNPEIVASVHAAAAWFERNSVSDVEYTSGPDGARRLVPAIGSAPLWSRYYDIVTDKPIFGDRDKSIHDDVNEISVERRRGYGWYGDWPVSVLKRYQGWKEGHPQIKPQ